MHEFVEQRAVVHERLPQILGVPGARAVVMDLLGVMPGAVVLHDLRVIGGHQLGTVAEVFHRVATIAHHLGDQLICLVQGRSGSVDELGLHSLPALGVTLASRGFQFVDVEPVTPIRDLAQVLICGALAAARLDLARVFGPESLVEARAATLQGIPHREHHQPREYEDPDDDLDDDDGVHDEPPQPCRCTAEQQHHP